MAHARLAGASMEKNDRMVTNTVIRPISATRAPISENTIPSNAVSSLKWDATPRHVCMAMRKTSPSEASANNPRTVQPTAFLGRTNVMNHVRVAKVMPKESPNTIGFRHEIGPAHAPPSTRNTAPWNAPLTISRPAHA